MTKIWYNTIYKKIVTNPNQRERERSSKLIDDLLQACCNTANKLVFVI
jgi:hypothetical protein